MDFLMGHSAWQIDQFPTCWPMNGLFVHWSRGWGVSSFSERLVLAATKQLYEWYFLSVCHTFLPLSPPGWRGIVVTVRAGRRAGGWAGVRAGGCQTCGTHISVTAWWNFIVRSSVELSRPVVVHCHGHLPICPIWACPWAKNLSNLAQIGSRLCGTHISETTGWIYPIWSFMDLSGPVVVQRHSYLPICPIWPCPWAKNLSNQAALGPHFAEPISLKPLDGFIPFEVLWNCLDP